MWSKLFRKKEVHSKIEFLIRELLPSYRIRIVDDIKILELAEKKSREIYYGSIKESIDTNNNVVKPTELVKKRVPEAPDLLPNSEEQPEAEQEICDESEQQDPQIHEETSSSS